MCFLQPRWPIWNVSCAVKTHNSCISVNMLFCQHELLQEQSSQFCSTNFLQEVCQWGLINSSWICFCHSEHADQECGPRLRDVIFPFNRLKQYSWSSAWETGIWFWAKRQRSHYTGMRPEEGHWDDSRSWSTWHAQKGQGKLVCLPCKLEN